MKYRKKPVVIDAYQWFGYRTDVIDPTVKMYDPYGEKIGKCLNCQEEWSLHGWVATLEGGHIVCKGDWIITGVKGEKYPCKPDIFTQTYEPVAEAKE